MPEERKLFGRHHDLFLLLVGFFFTSVVGAALGAYFQNRSWDYQERARAQSSETEAATRVFEDVSKLMDRRIYRMRQLNWKVRDFDGEARHEAEAAMKSYQQVLYEWNDALNRNRALVLRYFGKKTEAENFGPTHEGFKDAGDCLEEYYRLRLGLKDSPGERDRRCAGRARYDPIDEKLKELEQRVYTLNLKMIRLIQEGKVGAFHPEFRQDGGA